MSLHSTIKSTLNKPGYKGKLPIMKNLAFPENFVISIFYCKNLIQLFINHEIRGLLPLNEDEDASFIILTRKQSCMDHDRAFNITQ